MTSNPIVGLHRFYYDTTGKVLLAACGTVTKRMNESTGTWTDVGAPAATENTPDYFTTCAAVNKCYSANGVNVPFILNSSGAYVLLTSGGATEAPTTTLMFLPYRD